MLVGVKHAPVKLSVTKLAILASFQVYLKRVVDVTSVAKHLIVHIYATVVDIVTLKDGTYLRGIEHIFRICLQCLSSYAGKR